MHRFGRGIGPIKTVLLLTLLVSAAHVSAQSESCTLAPRTRLHPDMAIVVARGIDRLNLRALPALTMGIDGQLYAGMAMNIIGGPVCNSGLIWWRVELESGQRGWVAEATWNSYLIVPASTRSDPTPLEWTCPPFSARVCPAP